MRMSNGSDQSPNEDDDMKKTRPAATRPRRVFWALLALVLLGGAGLAGRALWAASRENASGGPGQGVKGPDNDARMPRASAGRGDEPRGQASGARGAKGGEGRLVPVVVTSVKRQDVPVFVDGLGSVLAFKTVTVRTQVDGRLDRVAFQEGQEVKRGTLLAQIDPRPFSIQLAQAEGARARDSAQLADARLNLARYEAVGKEKLIPQQQVDDQRALVAQLEGALKSDEAQVAQAKLMIDYAHITSPIDGVTGVRLVDQGNIVHPTDPNGLVVVTQLDPIAVLFTLPQDDLPRVTAAMAQGKLAVEALGRDGQDVLARGELALIDNQINAATATLRLKAIFPNPSRRLWPNQFVKARLYLGQQKGVLVVPSVAIQRGPQGAFVYTVGDDRTAAMKPVEVADLRDDIAVLGKGGAGGGVAEGMPVVVEGQFQLRPGAAVEVRRSGNATAAEGGGGRHGQRPGAATTAAQGRSP
jgi:multidrug efflux system membrane fusion protein